MIQEFMKSIGNKNFRILLLNNSKLFKKLREFLSVSAVYVER
jgi:hypothetical protein